MFSDSPVALAIEALQPKQCRYPMGEGVNFAFCPKDQMEGEPYCPYHYDATHLEPRSGPPRRPQPAGALPLQKA